MLFSLVEKTLPPAHQKWLLPAHFGAPATLMPVVILIVGAFLSSPVIIYSTAGEYPECARDNILH
jgi:hypothetical protein